LGGVDQVDLHLAGGRHDDVACQRDLVGRALEEAVLDGAIPPDDADAARRWLDQRRDLFEG